MGKRPDHHLKHDESIKAATNRIQKPAYRVVATGAIRWAAIAGTATGAVAKVRTTPQRPQNWAVTTF